MNGCKHKVRNYWVGGKAFMGKRLSSRAWATSKLVLNWGTSPGYFTLSSFSNSSAWRFVAVGRCALMSIVAWVNQTILPLPPLGLLDSFKGCAFSGVGGLPSVVTLRTSACYLLEGNMHDVKATYRRCWHWNGGGVRWGRVWEHQLESPWWSRLPRRLTKSSHQIWCRLK